MKDWTKLKILKKTIWVYIWQLQRAEDNNSDEVNQQQVTCPDSPQQIKKRRLLELQE